MRARLTRREALAAAGIGIAGAGGIAAATLAGSEAPSGPLFPRRGRQNVLLLIVDTLRADHLGCYGNAGMHTPNIDLLARQGFRFTRVFPEAMPTIPARRSIMTGRRVFPFRGWERWHGLGKSAGWEPIMPGTRTLATALRSAGYWTGYVTDTPSVAWSSSYLPFRETFDSFVQVDGQLLKPELTELVPAEEGARRLPAFLQQQVYIDQMRQYLAVNGILSDGRIRESDSSSARVFEEGMAALRRAARQRRPFFLVVDAFDPHEPWAIPSRYLDLYRPAGSEELEIGDVRYGPSDQWQEHELERLRMTYAAAVTMIDRWIGRLLDQLESRRLADSTVVLLVSDHGVLLGDREWVGKSAWLLHPELMHVPLIIRDPDGRGAGGASDWFASTHDIAPTLMSLGAGRSGASFEGADLTPLLAGEDPDEERDFAYGGYANDFFVRDDDWAFVSDNRLRGNRLYDLNADPGERHDLSSERTDVVDELYEKLLGEIRRKPPFYGEEQRLAEPRRLPGT